MEYRRLHSWKVDIKGAYKIQQHLKEKIILSKGEISVDKVAGTDVAFSNNKAIASVAVFNLADLINPLEIASASSEVNFPYIPGFLTFREGPAILKAFRKIRCRPDVILFDGQGLLHPRRMGVATHLGIILDIPTIGCAKSFLYGIYRLPLEKKGSYSFIRDKSTEEVLGVALRSRSRIKPLFVSPGYKIGLRQSIELILKLCPRFRIPEPLRQAHRLSEDAKRFL
jgi:deoxyribonuclease V